MRFLGAGTIGIAAIWTLATLTRPVVGGLVSTLIASRRTANADDRDRDLSPPWIFALAIGCLHHHRHPRLDLRPARRCLRRTPSG